MDPFETKWLNSEHDLIKELIEYRASSVLSANFSNDTSLVYLVLKSNIKMKESQIAKVLGLNLQNENSKALFIQIKSEIIQFSRELFSRTRLTSLLEVPLTDFKEACYIIGGHFKAVFFVPVSRRVYISSVVNQMSPNNTYIIPREPTHGASNLVSNSASLNSMPSTENTDIGNVDSSSASTSREEELIEFRSRFNQMWIIALWINQEYQNCIKNNKIL